MVWDTTLSALEMTFLVGTAMSHILVGFLLFHMLWKAAGLVRSNRLTTLMSLWVFTRLGIALVLLFLTTYLYKF